MTLLDVDVEKEIVIVVGQWKRWISGTRARMTRDADVDKKRAKGNGFSKAKKKGFFCIIVCSFPNKQERKRKESKFSICVMNFLGFGSSFFETWFLSCTYAETRL